MKSLVFSAKFGAFVGVLGAAACSGGGADRPISSSSGELAVDAGGCPGGGISDAATFQVRASCVYEISDAAPASACDEWSQAVGADWSAFVDECAGKNGALASTPCVTAGTVGECQLAPTCESQVRTYYFGTEGASSFTSACAATPGATWTP